MRTHPLAASQGAALRRPYLAHCVRHRPPACLVDVPSTALFADTTTASLSVDALGNDIFTFLVASVLVVPLSRLLDITPVLGFLAIGCAIGPFGLGFFSNSEADLQLGDFGIDFLLFIEGLQLSPERLRKLGAFFKLGLAQFLLTIAALTTANLYLGPQILETAERFIRLDDYIVRLILTTPVVAFTLAGAGALSSSAFVLPVLKQKGWEERPDGTAALAVLLLQDIAVAPLLVILPLIAGSGPQSGPELGLLVAKGTFGFGAVLAVGSVVLRQIFSVVASTRSSETFVAATLLVAIGMGGAAQELGLSTTTGAFAAGVLLAGSEYRQQIEADIKPFEGILLGIFFMTAGANLDPALCLQEWPTLLSGILAFLAAKLGLIFALGAFAFELSRAEAIRIALLLAGGGEFAFVVFKLAQDLGLLEAKLANLLTASVIISMSLTPLLGELATYVGELVERIDAGSTANAAADELFEEIDADGNGFIERVFLALTQAPNPDSALGSALIALSAAMPLDQQGRDAATLCAAGPTCLLTPAPPPPRTSCAAISSAAARRSETTRSSGSSRCSTSTATALSPGRSCATVMSMSSSARHATPRCSTRPAAARRRRSMQRALSSPRRPTPS